ncbi:TIGR04283 family arsenosugar biosynthesis glycosyltransferase [Candidatus Magnetaquicoccus inordinatus]|uniref:TIGR04283 family arsenosugar biosynthesis glycosyltransferase n=1 Tax=Candidatus Magnetaquicoccus inordinatus TaxID=2496818 RepID=UPI001D0E6786|nr:TIGR04283 family arsenosugar biosynthesis glycosyltransferase [Candidatus Magnetaquicoccus inordinatus]
MSLSIVIPVRQEAEGLADCLQALQSLRQAGVEIIVVDGESHDHSAAIARNWGAKVIVTAPGRSKQMNAGASVACGEIILFLHADTRLPPSAVILSLPTRLEAKKAHWGFFAVTISGRSWMLPVVAQMISWRSRLSKVATGDQALFVRRSLFNALGAFPDLPLMEDVAFSKSLRRHSAPLVISEPVCTSGRRWEKYGIWQTIFLMWRLRYSFWRGVSAEKLAKFYHY